MNTQPTSVSAYSLIVRVMGEMPAVAGSDVQGADQHDDDGRAGNPGHGEQPGQRVGGLIELPLPGVEGGTRGGGSHQGRSFLV